MHLGRVRKHRLDRHTGGDAAVLAYVLYSAGSEVSVSIFQCICNQNIHIYIYIYMYILKDVILSAPVLSQRIHNNVKVGKLAECIFDRL